LRSEDMPHKRNNHELHLVTQLEIQNDDWSYIGYENSAYHTMSPV
jgi:hypothetical protein